MTQDPEDALAQEAKLARAKDFVRGCMNTFDQTLSEEEIDEVARKVVEATTAPAEDPIPPDAQHLGG